MDGVIVCVGMWTIGFLFLMGFDPDRTRTWWMDVLFILVWPIRLGSLLGIYLVHPREEILKAIKECNNKGGNSEK